MLLGNILAYGGYAAFFGTLIYFILFGAATLAMFINVRSVKSNPVAVASAKSKYFKSVRSLTPVMGVFFLFTVVFTAASIASYQLLR